MIEVKPNEPREVANMPRSVGCEAVAPFTVPVGPFGYSLVLTASSLKVNGDDAIAWCDPDRHEIKISSRYPASVRIAKFWHELGHAIYAECDCRLQGPLGGEDMANLFSIGFAAMTPGRLEDIYEFLSQDDA